MKRLTIFVCMLMIVTVFVSCMTDRMSYDKRKDAEFVILKCGDDYYWCEHWEKALFSDGPELQLENGEFALVTADITVLNGGEAGFRNNPTIDKVKSIKKIALDDVMKLRALPNVSEYDFMAGENVLTRKIEEKVYYFAEEYGKYYAFLDGKCLGVYEDEAIVQCSRILFNGDLTNDELAERIATGKMQGDDYFIMSDKSDKGIYLDNLCYEYEKIGAVVSSDEFLKGDESQREGLLEPVLKQLIDDGRLRMYDIDMNTEQPYILLDYTCGGREKIILSEDII